MINLKIMTEGYYQVNICDSELIGTKINGTTISTHFYGDETSEEQVREHIKKATMINAIGKTAVKLVGEIKGEVMILDINGIPYTQVYRIK